MRRAPREARFSANRAMEVSSLEGTRPEVSVSHVGSSRVSVGSGGHVLSLSEGGAPTSVKIPRVPSSQGSSFGETKPAGSEDLLVRGQGRTLVEAQPATRSASFSYNNAKPPAGGALSGTRPPRWLALLIGAALLFCFGSFAYWNSAGYASAKGAPSSTGGMSPSSLRGSHSQFHWSKVLSSREGEGGAGGAGPQTYDFVLVTDLDHASRVRGNGIDHSGKKQKETWRAYLQLGTITFASGVLESDSGGGGATLSWGDRVEMQTHHGEAGRGFELSELQMYGGSLYSFDDRSGIVFDIRGDFKAVPVHILMEGDGETDKGFKTEWATVKDNILYVGSFGKEYTRGSEIVNRNNMWVKTIGPKGRIEHADWTPLFDKLREVTGTGFPGYLIHEAVAFSDTTREWIFLPRRESTLAYDDTEDERRGTNLILTANEDFSKVSARRVGKLTPERGFSSVKFLPGTGDRVVVALKSAEDAEAGTQQSFITAFDRQTLRVLLPETPVPGDFKYEGLEFARRSLEIEKR